MRSSAGLKAASVVAVLVALGIGAARVDVPRLSGPVKGDEATYIAMAFSLAKDGDLKYRPEDYRRFVELYHQGPEGIFLKRSLDLRWHLQARWPPVRIEKVPVPTDVELDYGKPFAHAVAAAPFVLIFGPSGLLLFNVLLIAVCAGCAVVFCRARSRPAAAALIGLAFVGASVAPVYLAWQTPEIFNFAMVFVAYFLWAYKDAAPSDARAWLRRPALDWVAAGLIAVATFSKPPNAALIAPLVLTAWLQRRWTRGVALGLVFAVATAGLFAINGLISGGMNYQGGDRNSFYTHFPFDDRRTPFESGNVMATEEANDENILAPSYLLPTLKLNAYYFLVGRDAGFVPYYFPGAVIGLVWLLRVRRARPWQWTVAGACAAAVLGVLIMAPASWNGGGGPIGNRYFLSLYPPLLFLVPAGTGLLTGAAAALGGLIFLGSILLHPFAASREPWRNPERWPLRELPVEFTLINDIPVKLNIQRGRILVSENPEVFLYYMDRHTYFQEPKGFWVAPGRADIVIRTAKPLTNLELRLSSPIDNRVEVSLGRSRNEVVLGKGQEQTLRFRPEPGIRANGYQILLRITTAAGFYPKQFNPASTDTRHLGVFITPTYEAK